MNALQTEVVRHLQMLSHRQLEYVSRKTGIQVEIIDRLSRVVNAQESFPPNDWEDVTRVLLVLLDKERVRVFWMRYVFLIVVVIAIAVIKGV